MSEKNNKYAIIVEYIGTSFSGSQFQPEQITIQSEIERVIKILTKEEIKTVFSGRTDSGVHAKCQFVHFYTDRELDKKRFIYSINAMLPSNISVKQLMKVDKSFHSQKSARFRWYRYIINNGQARSVFLKDLSTHIRDDLNLEEMQKALNYISGCHDFTSFKKTNSDNPAKECNLMYASCRKKSDIIYIDLIANRFLYNMVRIIVGTLIEIGKGVYKAERMLDVLKAKDRRQAGNTADPNGLILMRVGYDEKYNLNELMNMEATNEQNLLCKAS
ncbi:MAG TPA: tRNA pseudouridine(38-40) synthase TruA [Candidatus Gastranaerophilales bacterium]|nr:tRNA pseudouridine(38-40) synthase TruA [Candidatus Gastranaerophilales bacterium]